MRNDNYCKRIVRGGLLFKRIINFTVYYHTTLYAVLMTNGVKQRHVFRLLQHVATVTSPVVFTIYVLKNNNIHLQINCNSLVTRAEENNSHNISKSECHLSQ